MLLEALELASRSDKSEKLQPSETLTIEHLLPQEWAKHWPMQDGSDEEKETEREKLLHTLGNLTLLTNKLNPAISNGPWDKKLVEIDKFSVLALNRELRPYKNWNEEMIGKRGASLFEVARKIWPYPGEGK